MTAKIRFALVGTSGIAPAHIAAVKNNNDAELIYIHSRSYDRAKHWAGHYGLRPAQHFEDILNDRSIDAVIIATDPARHLEFAFLALEAGKHILIEKPIDHDLDNAVTFMRKSRGRENIVSVVSQQRFDPDFTALRNNLLNGKVANSNEPYLPLLFQYIESFSSLFNGNVWVRPVYLIQINMVSLQPFQAGLASGD